jgi:transcriptional regulator with XRE-family HTH domain
VNVAKSLKAARRRAGLSQRELARATGVAQPTIARLEQGIDNPRVETVQRLLAACGETLVVLALPGLGVDRSEIRELLAVSPAERLRMLTDEARVLERLSAARAVG